MWKLDRREKAQVPGHYAYVLRSYYIDRVHYLCYVRRKLSSTQVNTLWQTKRYIKTNVLSKLKKRKRNIFLLFRKPLSTLSKISSVIPFQSLKNYFSTRKSEF